MKQLLVAHVKLKMILKLIQKFNPCVNKHSSCQTSSINSKRKSFDQVAMLRDFDSIKNINELSFRLEDTTYTAVQCELRS